MVLAYSLDQEEAIQNIFFILLYLVRFLRSSRRKVRKIERFYAFITLGYRQNHKLQPRFVGLGLVVREWYWPIPWTRRKRFRIYFSFCCISHGFGGVVDGKYAKTRRNNNNNNKPTMTPVESLQITNFSEANSRSQQIKIA